MSIEEIQIINSDIDEVTVYRGNALVSRKAEIPLKLEESIKIIGLPLSLDDSSIRIRVVSSRSSLRASDFRVILEAPEPDKELPPPDNKKLNKLRQMREKIQMQINLTNKFLERINSMPFHSRGIPEDTLIPSVTPIASRKLLLTFSLDRKSKLVSKRRNLQVKNDEIERDLFELEDKISRESTVRQNRENELRKSVIINFDSSGKITGKADLFLEYLIPGARWFPVYGLNISKDYSKYFLTMRGMIKQQTGENWNNVRINLSTAEAVRWMELPKLSSRIFGRPKPVLPASGWRKAPEGISVLFSDYDRFKERFPQKQTEDRFRDYSVSDDSGYDNDESSFGESEEPYEEYDKEMDVEAAMPMASYSIEIAEPKMSKKIRSSAPLKRKEEIAMDDLSNFKSDHQDMPVVSDEYSAGPDLLDYNKMRLESADSIYRGKLKKTPVHEQYMVSIDKADKVYESINSAMETGSGPVPVSCSEPVSYDGFDYSFRTDSSVDIPSDASYHIRPLSSYESKGEMHYIAVPRESSDVFRFIKFTNPLDAPVLAGPVEISIDTNYLLSSGIDTVPPGGDINLGVGIEQAIKISRNTLFKEETTGLIKGNLGLNHQINIDVENNLKIAAYVEIRERIAVPPEDKPEKDEKVKVAVIKVNPEWDEYNQDPNYINGGYRWKVDVRPGEKRHFHVHYEIQIPSQYEIVGGNRREN